MSKEYAVNRIAILMGGRLAEEIMGKPFAVQHVPEEALRAQYTSATNPFERSFAALMLYYANGEVIDMTGTLGAFPVDLRTVREHVRASQRWTTASAPPPS